MKKSRNMRYNLIVNENMLYYENFVDKILPLLLYDPF